MARSLQAGAPADGELACLFAVPLLIDYRALRPGDHNGAGGDGRLSNQVH
jgi:hypothetical protein